MSTDPTRTVTKKSIADRLMWGIVVTVFLGHFIPLFIAAIIPLFVYPVVFIVGIAELHKAKARQADHPPWHHYLLSPVFASTVGVLHLLLLLSKKTSDIDLLSPLLLGAILAWPIVWGISRLVLRWFSHN